MRDIFDLFVICKLPSGIASNAWKLVLFFPSEMLVSSVLMTLATAHVLKWPPPNLQKRSARPDLRYIDDIHSMNTVYIL